MSKTGVNNKGGRPKGKKNDATLIKEKVETAIKQRIFKINNSLLNAQQSIAKGQQFLYKIVTTRYTGKYGNMYEVMSKNNSKTVTLQKFHFLFLQSPNKHQFVV